MMALLRSVLDRLTLYLPVLLMAALAMATYWLVRSTPMAAAPAPQAVLRHEPDYLMRQFAVQTFDALGRLKSEVSGAQAHHYPDTDTLEIDQVRIQSYDAAGSLTTATAARALTNGDGTEVQLMGGARVVRPAGKNAQGQVQPALSFAGDALQAFTETERVISDQPVVLIRGNDRFSADRMDYDHRQRVVQLDGRVKGVLMPTPRPTP